MLPDTVRVILVYVTRQRMQIRLNALITLDFQEAAFVSYSENPVIDTVNKILYA